MSYWFSFLRSGAENEEEEVIEPQPGTSTESEDRSTTSMLRGFPEDQRRHIRNVLERAEKSKTQAKVVVDSDVLQHVKLRQEQRDSCSEQSFDNDEEELLQMESMDDTMEVTLGPSRDYSPFVTSDMSLGDSNDRCYTPSISIDVPMDPTPEPNIVTRGVKLLSAKIMEWVKSLDEEDGYVSLQPKGDPYVDSIIEEGAEWFYEGSILDDYCSHLARNLCILAISDYMNLTPIQRVQHYNSIVNYAQHLTETIITSALTEIRSSKRKNLARNFSRFVAETIDWAVREAVSKQTSSSFAPRIVITEESMVNVTEEADTAYDSILDNVANELASQALHTVITELQFEDQPTPLTSDATYVILSENESPQPESTTQSPSDEEHRFEVTDSNVYNILNEFADNEVPLDSWKHAQDIEGHLESDVDADLTINEEDAVQIVEAEDPMSSMSLNDEKSEELTAEELEQILRVQQRAEEMQLFDLPQTTFDSTPKPESQELTEEEWAYIRRVERMSEQEDQLDDLVESEEVDVPKYFYERHTTSTSVFTAINLESPATEEFSNSGSSTPIELTETPTKQSKPIAEWIQVEEAIQSSSSSSTSGADDFDSDSPTELVESFPIDETDEDQMIVDEHSAVEVQQTRPVIEELTATELKQLEQTDLVESFEIGDEPSTEQSSSTLTPDDSEKTESPDSQVEESVAESILMPKDEIYESNETTTKSLHQLIPTIEIFEVKTPASSPTELSTFDQFTADDPKQLETIEQVAQQLSSIESTSEDVCPEVTIEVVPQSSSSSPTESADDLTDSEAIDSFPIEDSQSADELDATSPVTVIEVKRSAPPRPPAPKKTRPTDFNYPSVDASANYDALFIPEVMVQPPTPLIPRSDSDEVSSVYTTSDEDSRDEKQLNQMAKELAITALKSVQSELKSDAEDQPTSLSTDSSPTTSGADDELSIASMTRDSFEDLENISADERSDDQYRSQTGTTNAKEPDYERSIGESEITQLAQHTPLERDESTATSSADSEMADESETMETHEQTIPQPTVSDIEQEHQLTLEELRHIERIRQMAEEQELFSQVIEGDAKLRSQHSSATSGADSQLATEPSFDAEVEEREQLILREESPAIHEFQLSADELAHIAMIERMAIEMDESMEDKMVQIPADLEGQQSSATSTADSHVSAMTSVETEELEGSTTNIKTTNEDVQLTTDELAHIERIRQMAEAYQRNQTVAEITPIAPSTFELTAEEIEQIERVKRMAETFGFTNHDEIETKETSTKPPISSSSSSMVVQDVEESFEHLRQLADDLEHIAALEQGGSIERSSTTTSGADKTSTRQSPMPSEESGLLSIAEDNESFEEAPIAVEQETESSRTESADKSDDQSDREDQLEIWPTDDQVEFDYQQTEIVRSQEETTAIPSTTTPLIVPTENDIEMLQTSVEHTTVEIVEAPEIHKTEELEIPQQQIDEEFTIDTTVYGIPVEPIHYVDVTVVRIDGFDWLKKKPVDEEQDEEVKTIEPTRPVQLPQIPNALPNDAQEALIPPIPPRSARMPPILRRVLPHEMSPTTPTSSNSSEESPPSIMAGDSFEEDELLAPSRIEEEEVVTPRNQPPPIPPTSRPIGQYKLPAVKVGPQLTSLPVVANGTIVKEQLVLKKDDQPSVVKAASKKPPPRPQPPKLIQPEPIRERIDTIEIEVQKTTGTSFEILQSVAEEIERPLFINSIHSSDSDSEPCYGDSEPEAQSSTPTSGADSDVESLGESSSERQSSVEQDLSLSPKEVKQTSETVPTFDAPTKEESTVTSGADTPELSEPSELTQPSVDVETKLPPQRPPPPVKQSADPQSSSDLVTTEIASKTGLPIRLPPPSNFSLTADEFAHISMIQKMAEVDSTFQPEVTSEYVDAKLERPSSSETSGADSQPQESMNRSISSITSGADENSIDVSESDYDNQQSAMKIEDRLQRLRPAHSYRSFYESPGNIHEGPFFAKLMEPQPTIIEQTPEFNQIELDYVEQFISNTTDLPTVISSFAFVPDELEGSLASSEGEIADYGQEAEDDELSENSLSESPQIGELNEMERRHIEDVKKIAAQLSTNAFDNVYQDIAANEMYARRLAKWKAQTQQSDELESNYDEEEVPVCVDEKQEVEIVESLTATVFDTATSEVLFAIPIEHKLSSQQSVVQFTEEELEHFAKIQQMAEQMDEIDPLAQFDNLELLPIPEESTTLPTVEETNQQPLDLPLQSLEQKSESEKSTPTSGADSDEDVVSSFDEPAEAIVQHPIEEQFELLNDKPQNSNYEAAEARTDGPFETENIVVESLVSTKEVVEELTQEELDHIVRIQQMAEQMEAIDPTAQLEQLQLATEESTKTMLPDIDVPDTEVEPKSADSTPTSSADSQVDASFDESEQSEAIVQMAVKERFERLRHLSHYATYESPGNHGDGPFEATTIELEVPVKLEPIDKDVVEELTQEELDHIARIRQMAEQMESIQLPFMEDDEQQLQSQESTTTSGADLETMPSLDMDEPIYEQTAIKERFERLKHLSHLPTYESPGNHGDGPFEAQTIELEVPVKLVSEVEEVVEELTQEELDHIARIQQMAEQMDGFNVPIFQTPQVVDVPKQTQPDVLTEEELQHIARIQQMAEDISLIDTQQPRTSQFALEKQSSSLTSGADSDRESVAEDSVENAPEAVQRQPSEQSTVTSGADEMSDIEVSEPEHMDYDLPGTTREESLVHIVDQLESISPVDIQTVSSESQAEPALESASEPQTRMLNDKIEDMHQVLQYANYDNSNAQNNGPFETVNIEVESPVATKEVVEELTQEELEHIARIQQMAEQMSMFDTQQHPFDVQLKTSQFTLEKQFSSLTSGADETSERESDMELSGKNTPEVVQRQSSEQSTITSGAEEVSDKKEVKLPEYSDQFLQPVEDFELPDAMREGLNADEYGHIELIKQAAIEQQKLSGTDHLEETSDRSAADSEAEDQLSSMQMVADKIAAFDSLQYSMPTRSFAHEMSMDVNVESEASSEVQQSSPSSLTSDHKPTSIRSEDSAEKPGPSDVKEKSERQLVPFADSSLLSIDIEDNDLPTAMREGLTAAEFGHIELIKQSGIEETRSTVEFATIKNANFEVSVESSPPTSGADSEESERESPSIDQLVPINEEIEVKTPATSPTEIADFDQIADTQLEDVQLLADQLSTIETTTSQLEEQSTDIDREDEQAVILESFKAVESEVDEPKLTLEEIDHIERVRRLAEEMEVTSGFQFSPFDLFTSTERTITREHVTQRPILSTSTSGADEVDSPTDFEENETPTPNVEVEESSYVQEVQQVVDLEWQNWRPVTPLEVIHEVAESTEINETIEETSWPKVEIQIDAEPESIDDDFDFVETSQELTQSQLVPQAETTTPIAIKLPTKLTHEELEHIARIQQMAEQMSGFDVPIFSAQQTTVENTEVKEPEYTQPSELSTAELEHIKQIELMAEQMSMFDSLPEPSKFPLKRQSTSLTSGADEEMMNEDESERDDYEDLRNALSAEYPKSPSEEFEIEQRIVQQPSITSTATSGADPTVSTPTINESVDEQETESLLTIDYRHEKRASWANIEERELESDLSALELERIERLRLAAEEMEMNDSEAYQLLDQLVDKQEELPDKLSDLLESTSPVEVCIVNSKVQTKPILGFATEPQTKKIRDQVQRLRHISYRATYESPGNHGDGPFEATMIEMQIPVQLEPEDKDVVEELTEEELKKIALDSRQQSFVERSESSSTSGADMDTTPSSDMEEPIYEQTAIKERFERLRHLSHLPTYESPGNHGDGPFDATTIELEAPVKLVAEVEEIVEELTQEELDHIARIQQMAEQMDGFNVPIFQTPQVVDVPKQTQPDVLTEEELQHIARIQQMAEDISLIDTQQPRTSQFALEKQSSSLTSGADSERESVAEDSVEDAPEAVQRQPSEQSTVTSGADEMSDIEVSEPEHIDYDLPDTTREESLVDIVDQLESISPVDIQTVSSELQAEPALESASEPQTRMLNDKIEDMHQVLQYANYDNSNAQNDGPFETVNIEVESPVATKEVVEELTQEELEHIARIQQMAEQINAFETLKSTNEEVTNQMPLDLNIVETEVQLKSEDSTPTSSADSQTDATTSFDNSLELVKEETIIPMAVKERVERLRYLSHLPTYESPGNHGDGPFDATTIELEAPVKLVAEVEEVVEELTQEELDHIARIQQMAEHLNAFDPFAQFEVKDSVIEESTSPMLADVNVPRSEASTPTGSADSEIDATTSFDESEKVETFVQTAINDHTEYVHQHTQLPTYETADDDAGPFETETLEIKIEETLLTKDVVEELTQEELEHIARIQRMAEEMDSIPDSAFMITNRVQTSELEKPLESSPVGFSEQRLQHQESSATSGADMESVPSFEEPNPIHEPTTVQLTAEELAHIAKIQQMAEQMDSLPFDNVQVSDLNSTPFVAPEPQLTQEELEHIAMVTQMAENWANFGTTIQDQPTALESPTKERQPSLSDESETDDSLRREEEPLITPTDEIDVQPPVFEAPRRVNPFITRQTTKPELKPIAPVKTEEPELTLEEINHIEQIRRMAEMSMTDTTDFVFPIQHPASHLPQQQSIKSIESPTRHSSSATSGADSERSDKSPDLIVEDSFEDRELLEKPTVEEQTTTTKLQVAEELNDEYEHSSATSSADSETALSFDLEEKETLIPSSIQEPVETDANEVEMLQTVEPISRQLTASSATSGADSQPSNRRLSPTEIFGDSFEDEALLPSEPAIQFDSTAHRLREQDSLNDQWPGTELTDGSRKSSATSGADSIGSRTEESKSMEKPIELLTSDEIAHIERIQRLAEEMEMLETKLPIETQEVDSTNQIEDERTTVQKSFDHHYRLPSTVDEIDLVVEETPEKLEISKPYDWRSAIQQSSQTTISYTDRLRRSLPHEYIHSSHSVEETRSKRRLTEKSSSVQIIYPQSLAADQRKLSWTAEATSQRSIPTITTTQPAVEPTINPFEECERRSVQQAGSVLCNIDFMVKLNFLARRITENIAEAAADDLSKVIQMKSNPRARYFGDDYLLEFLDSQSETSEEADDEIPTFDMKLDYEVETIHEDAIERPAFDIFGMFRRKSTVERPRSALAFLQQRRYSPLPVPEVSSRKGSEVKVGDITQLLHRTSIGSAESSRADSSFNLPVDALEHLSVEEREHIQRVMANASRSHTTPQDSRRSSSAMHSLPSMDELSEKERQHINEVMLKAEQRQAPFIISPSINKSRSTGDRLDEQARELLPTIESMDKPEIISESSVQETQQLTEAEMLQIAQVQERIAAVEAEDQKRSREAEIAKIEDEFRATKAAITTADATATQQKSPSFGGFRMGIGSLKSALKKTQQKVNENVNAIVQSTSQVVDKPTESLRRPEPTLELKPTNLMETSTDDRAKSPTFELDYTPKFTHPVETIESEPSTTFLQSTFDSKTATSPPSSRSSSTESADRSLNELDDAVVCADENIAWLQERIEAMNQTLEAYETEEISSNEDANSQRQNEFAVDEQTANGMMESVDAKWPEDLVDEAADDETDFYEHEVRLRAAKETKRDDGRRADGDEEAAPVAFLGHANRPEKDEKDEKTTEEDRNTVVTTTFGGAESPRNELPSALPTSSDPPTSNQPTTITPDRSFGGMFSSGKSTGFGGFGGFGKLASGALKGAKQASEQLQAKAQQAAQIAQQAASTGDLTQIGNQLTAPTRPSRSQSAANVNAEPTTPAIDPTALMPGMEHLSEEERMKIMAVMACAEIDSTQPVQSKVVEKPSNEPTAKEIAEAAALGLDEEALRGLSAAEREQIISVMRMAAADDVEVTTKPIGSLASTISPTTSGIATERPISPKPSDEQPRVSSAVESGYVTAPSSTISSYSMDQSLNNDIVQTEPLVDREEKLATDYHLVDSESYDKLMNEPLNTEPMIIQQEPPSLYSDYEQMGPELSTIVEDVQEPQIEDDDLWIQQPRQEYRWDEGNHQRAGRMWETVFTDDGDMAASEYDEIQPHVSYEQRDPSPIIWQANSTQLPQQEHAELIYESQDQQNRMELYGRTADGSFEVQMEDPLSPTTMIVSSTLAENAVAKAEREVTKRTPEIMVTQEEEDSDAETSPSDEDDYPDQVIAAPTAPMTPNQMEKQERENADAAQEVLRQIQSFGEAADDEFDVRWASSMNKKEQPIEPTVTKPEEPKAEPAKRINPFLDSPEDEEPEVTVEQVNLDSDDVEYNQAVHSYYKNSELYHRPGPVYTILEGDEGTSPQPNRESRYNPQLLERRPLHGTTVPSLVPVDMKRKPKDPIIIPTTTSTTGSQVATTTSVTTSNGPITPIRTAPPPPTDKVDETENQQRRLVHQGAAHFTTDIPQPDDFVPIHTVEPSSCVVAPSDAAFLEQTFGSRLAESSTLGSQLPSADHAVHEVTDDDQTTPRLKRSPAMIIPTDKPITTTADHFQYPTTSTSAVRYVDEDALLQSAGISEMGRRKLPSLPANHSTSLAQQLQDHQPATSTPTTSSLLHYHQMRSNAPIYYTHAPEQKDALIQHSQQSSGVSTGNVSFSNVYFDSKNTAASRLVDHRLRSVEFDTRVAPPTSSVATSTHPVDPAIIPGAQFRSAPVQTASSGPRLISSSSTQRSNVVQPSKISDTIAQLLFKQELRQALSRRRFAQETTEIEANHREFVIRRMLTSGLIPAELRREIDAQPDVVHCELPYELIAGARIVPPGRDLRRSRFYGSSYSASASTRTSPQRLKSPLHFPRYTTQTDELRSDYPTAVGSWSSPTKKSVGCQSEPERSVRIEEPRYGTNAIYTTDRFASDLFAEERASSLRRPFDQSYAQTSPRYGHPTTTPIQRRPLAVDSATQTLVASETQTDGFLESADVHHSSLGRQSKRIPKPTNVQADYSGSIGDYTQQRNAYAATDDLLEATRSYFEEYDRRLRDGTDAYARSRLAQPSISNSLPASTWNLPSGSEETAAEMEWKRRQVAAELERRKARVASLIDLRNSTANWNGDWRKTRVRERPYDGVYGSLPRGYTNERDQWDTQIYAQRGRAQPYGSLPRDFERWMDVEGAEELYRPSRFGTRRYGARIDDYGRRAQPTEDTTLLSDYANYVNAQINAAGFLDDPTQLESTPARQRPAYLADDPTVYRPPTSRYDTMDDNYSIRRPTQSILRSHAPFVGSADDVYTTTRYPPGTTMTRPRYGAGPMTLQKQSPSADFVYSRREANYGARPVQPIGDYGNYELRRAMDYANRNPVGVDPWQQPTAYQTPTGYQQSVGYQQPTNYPSTQLPSNLTYGTYTPAYRTPRQPVNTMPLNGNWDVRWPTTQPTYPPRMPSYTCSTQPRPQPQPYYQLSPQNYQPVSVLNTASLGRNEKRTTGILSTPRSHKHQRNGQSMQNLTANRRSPQQNGHHVHSRSRNGTKIKRLLLTRLYRHANVYHDLGFRVTGGKRLSNGDLGAFITAVNRSRPYDTLGEVKEGDQVLEWNGVLLRGKTFEEVERIIDATSGEIEIVVKSGENKSHKLRHSMNENIYDLTTDETKNFSPREAPPVPAHRKSISRSYVDQEDISRKQRLHYQVHAQNDNYGQLQLALGYDQLNGVLLVTVISAQGLRCREYNNSIVLPNPFVKIYLLPGRKVVNKRRTKYVSNTLNPEWHQTVDYLVSYDELPSHYLELTVWDYDKYNDNICLGQLTLYIDVSMLDNVPRFYELQPADKMLFTAQGVPSNAPYTKPRTITNSNYFYNPANLDLGYPAI